MARWISDENWDALMAGLVEGRYQLLLGAGASRNATGPLGPPMTGWELAQSMAQDFGIPGKPDGKLRQVFSMARHRQSASGSDVMAYLRERYTNCTPPDWHRDLVSIPWRYIWSLNIDDVIENAYRSFGEDAIQRLASVSWTDPHRVPTPDEVILVHLHGKATATNPDALVFDVSTYLLAASSRHRWHSIFADRYADTPTIILGARMSEEVDLEAVLDRGRLSDPGGPPSLIVLRTIDEFDRERFRSWNLIPVEATIADFLAELRANWADYAAGVANTPEASPELISPNALAFLNQWIRIEPATEMRVDRYHDFYGGHEPEYLDVVNDLDAHRDIRPELLGIMADEHPQHALVISGPPFAGKSTSAMRLVRDMAQAGWQAYRLDPEFRPSVDAALWWLRRFPRTVLFADGVADFAPDLSGLLGRTVELSVPLHFVGVERGSRMKEIEREFGDTPGYKQVPLMSILSRPEVDRVLAKLTKPGRLGRVVGRSQGGQRRYFLREHGGELFSALSELEGAEGFLERVRRKYSRLDSAEKRTAFHAVALTGALGYGLPFGLCMVVSGLTPVELDTALQQNADFAEVIAVRRSRMYPRHRVFGSYMLQSAFSKAENFHVTQRLAEALAPDLSVAAIRIRSYAYRIARQLLDYKILGDWIGLSELERWYSSIQELFEWNARFWEQRALAASHDSRHAPAVSWAMKAVDVHRDALTLNTLAVILLRKSLDEHEPENGSLEGYLEATALLQEARIVADRSTEYPYTTFFEYTLAWTQRVVDAGLDVPPEVIQRWNDWWYAASTLLEFVGPNAQATLREWQRRWLSVATHS
jgi:hypothetical protein